VHLDARACLTVSPELAANYPWAIDWDEDEAVDAAVEKMRRLKEAGSTLLWISLSSHRKQPRLVARVAERSPVNIVASTGLYVLKEIPRYFDSEGRRTGGRRGTLVTCSSRHRQGSKASTSRLQC